MLDKCSWVFSGSTADWDLSLEQCDIAGPPELSQQDLLNKVQKEIELVLGWSNCAISALYLTDERGQHAGLAAG